MFVVERNALGFYAHGWQPAMGIDNVFMERLWRTVKYEEVYLKAYESIAEARHSLGEFFEFYNTGRRHQSIENQTPDHVYFDSAAKLAA